MVTMKDDLISRQVAINTVRNLYINNPKINNDYVYDMALDQADDILKNLLSAQPEIIRCVDCINFYNNHLCLHWSKHGTIEVKPNDFCSYAERK